jgi:hypothetical protein
MNIFQGDNADLLLMSKEADESSLRNVVLCIQQTVLTILTYFMTTSDQKSRDH